MSAGRGTTTTFSRSWCGCWSSPSSTHAAPHVCLDAASRRFTKHAAEPLSVFAIADRSIYAPGSGSGGLSPLYFMVCLHFVSAAWTQPRGNITSNCC